MISFSPSIESEIVEVQFKSLPLRGVNRESTSITDTGDKPIFMNFWATWCPPCIAEMPSMRKLYEDYKDKVEFYFITQEDKKTVEAFYNKREYNFPTYNAMTRVPDVFSGSSIPATYIVSKKGEVLVNKKGAANWNSSTIRNLLDRLVKE